jgi:hypothetical protein
MKKSTIGLAMAIAAAASLVTVGASAQTRGVTSTEICFHATVSWLPPKKSVVVERRNTLRGGQLRAGHLRPLPDHRRDRATRYRGGAGCAAAIGRDGCSPSSVHSAPMNNACFGIVRRGRASLFPLSARARGDPSRRRFYGAASTVDQIRSGMLLRQEQGQERLRDVSGFDFGKGLEARDSATALGIRSSGTAYKPTDQDFTARSPRCVRPV